MEEAMSEFVSLKERFSKFEKNFKKCSTANRTKGYLEGRLKGIEELWQSVCDANVIINSYKDDDNRTIQYFEDDEFGEMENKYFVLVGSIRDYLNALNPKPKENEPLNRSNFSFNGNSHPNQSNVKLPKIDLPKFSGSYHTWLSFKNRFTTLIRDNASLSNVEKLEYLQSCVTHEAERTIKRYQITDQNYELAWQRLNEKYDNQRILQVTQVETLIDRNVITKESATEIRELIDVIQECLESLKNLNVDTATWDIMLIVLITRKLPFKTREHWEQELKPSEVPTLKQLLEFLEKRYRTLESLEIVGASETDKAVKTQSNNRNKPTQSTNQRFNCLVCNNSSHSLIMCDKFLNMPLPNRYAFAKAKNICTNCLAISHTTVDCKSKKTCFKCRRRHHTLLHKDESNSSHPSNSVVNSTANSNPFNHHTQSRAYVTNSSQSVNQTQSAPITQSNQSGHSTKNTQQSRRALTTAVNDQSSVPILKNVSQKEVLFPTAIVKVKSKSGTIYTLRALLDQCSEGAFIKASVMKMLGLKSYSIPAFEVKALEDITTSTVESSTQFELIIEPTETINVEAYVVKTLVGILPKTQVKWQDSIFKNIRLADPTFATPGNVDIMLGSDMYAKVLLEGVLKEDGYLAQNTKFGWIISGRQNDNVQPRYSTCLHTRIYPVKEDPNEILKKFWEMEELPKMKKPLTTEETKCEEVFKNSYRRRSDGRVQVKLPFKEDPSKVLGASRNLAVARWIAMEKKLEQNPGLKEDYMKAIQEHWDLGHMTRVNTKESDHRIIDSDGKLKYSCYYIPHHAVIREESTTTKTRIVFDASAKTSTKKSLNEILMIGPTIQESLIVRIIKWRLFKYVLRGDITKMYRQIMVYDEDVNYQRMVFRFNKSDPIEDFSLVTLTFGTASAPYMAIRTLKQLAIDEAENYPIGAAVLSSDFHVDDLLTGGDSVEQVKEIWSQTMNLLKSAGFPMRKWSSNDNKILEQIPAEEREIKSREIQIDDSIKTLGIGWLPISDHFFFKLPEFNANESVTKRTFLSQAAKLFDPLGWLAPAIIKPKIMFQSLWKENLEWDDQISTHLAQEWRSFREKLHHLEEIRIPRWYGFESIGYEIELHGFCDASVKAYGAVVYVKSTDAKGNSKVQLVMAKSRVAPIQTIRLPRLELCGALLLANLIQSISEDLNISKSYCWTDSSITLGWINSSPDKFKTFVSNRISEIQSVTNSKDWRHVDTKDNPADCLSRGLNAEELKSYKLWWNGPKWLVYPKERWPKNPNVKIPEDEMEVKRVKVLMTMGNDFFSSLQEKFSSFRLLVRVTARIRRLFSKNNPKSKCLLLKEIEDARNFWIKTVQGSVFTEEIKAIKKAKQIHGKSKLLSFYPFLDSKGLLRIGGRLKEAIVDYDSKHQIIIPKDSIIATLIINDAHEITKHGGTQLTMTYTRTQYWIMDTKNAVRNQIRNCVICHRYSKQTQEQLMGHLPEPRVNMSRAFLHTGVDYAGPIQVLTVRKPGKRQVTKGYLALFVCFCTKAVHLEVVSNYTTEAFLAAFTRFRSRRGLPSSMYSDNAKTFVGAKNELDEDYKIIKETLEPELADIILKDNVQWWFIPPQASHWGGLWEAGVKSMKFHLKRMIGESVHTFEELTTMLSEIEACMNSRPLCPVSNDPNDLSILTPGHFIIGDNLLAPPRPTLLNVKVSQLSKWKQIAQRVEHFTKRWKAEYLSRLQRRNKWMRQCENVALGDMVLIKDDDLPPSKWLMGRVIEIHEDDEGLVRKVQVKTATTSLLRSIHKISILPIDKPVENGHLPNSLSV